MLYSVNEASAWWKNKYNFCDWAYTIQGMNLGVAICRVLSYPSNYGKQFENPSQTLVRDGP